MLLEEVCGGCGHVMCTLTVPRQSPLSRVIQRICSRPSVTTIPFGPRQQLLYLFLRVDISKRGSSQSIPMAYQKRMILRAAVFRCESSACRHSLKCMLESTNANDYQLKFSQQHDKFYPLVLHRKCEANIRPAPDSRPRASLAVVPLFVGIRWFIDHRGKLLVQTFASSARHESAAVSACS